MARYIDRPQLADEYFNASAVLPYDLMIENIKAAINEAYDFFNSVNTFSSHSSAQFCAREPSYTSNPIHTRSDTCLTSLRCTGLLKGNDENASKKIHDMTAAQAEPLGKTFGNQHHQPYLNPENPREFFDVDVWNDDLEGLKKFFSDPNMAQVMSQ